MEALTIHEAARTTGWSPRMLRYVERVGLVEPERSASGYRLRFQHPRTGVWLEFEAPLPPDMQQTLAALRQYRRRS